MLTESQEKDFETVEHRLRDGIVKYDEVEALSRLRAALSKAQSTEPPQRFCPHCGHFISSECVVAK